MPSINLTLLGIVFTVLVVAGLLSYQLGKSNTKKKQAEKDADALAKANKVAAKPYVDNPLDGMRDTE